MSNAVITAVAWIGLGLHLIVGILVLRSAAPRQLVPALNLATAACVVAYWAQRWFGYLFRGISWSAFDQAIPLFALAVCILAGLSLFSQYPAASLNWVAFVIHFAVCLCAVLFVTFFRMKLF